MKEKDSEDQVSENSPVDANDNRLEAVRDLLFGPNDQAYREEFKEIKSQVAKNKEDSEKKSDALNQDLIARLDKLENKLTEKVSELSSNVNARLDGLNADKVDRKQLAKLLQTIAKELEA